MSTSPRSFPETEDPFQNASAPPPPPSPTTSPTMSTPSSLPVRISSLRPVQLHPNHPIVNQNQPAPILQPHTSALTPQQSIHNQGIPYMQQQEYQQSYPYPYPPSTWPPNLPPPPPKSSSITVTTPQLHTLPPAMSTTYQPQVQHHYQQPNIQQGSSNQYVSSTALPCSMPISSQMTHGSSYYRQPIPQHHYPISSQMQNQQLPTFSNPMSASQMPVHQPHQYSAPLSTPIITSMPSSISTSAHMPLSRLPQPPPPGYPLAPNSDQIAGVTLSADSSPSSVSSQPPPGYPAANTLPPSVATSSVGENHDAWSAPTDTIVSSGYADYASDTLSNPGKLGRLWRRRKGYARDKSREVAKDILPDPNS